MQGTFQRNQTFRKLSSSNKLNCIIRNVQSDALCNLMHLLILFSCFAPQYSRLNNCRKFLFVHRNFIIEINWVIESFLRFDKKIQNFSLKKIKQKVWQLHKMDYMLFVNISISYIKKRDCSSTVMISSPERHFVYLRVN